MPHRYRCRYPLLLSLSAYIFGLAIEGSGNGDKHKNVWMYLTAAATIGLAKLQGELQGRERKQFREDTIDGWRRLLFLIQLTGKDGCYFCYN